MNGMDMKRGEEKDTIKVKGRCEVLASTKEKQAPCNAEVSTLQSSTLKDPDWRNINKSVQSKRTQGTQRGAGYQHDSFIENPYQTLVINEDERPHDYQRPKKKGSKEDYRYPRTYERKQTEQDNVYDLLDIEDKKHLKPCDDDDGEDALEKADDQFKMLIEPTTTGDIEGDAEHLFHGNLKLQRIMNEYYEDFKKGKTELTTKEFFQVRYLFSVFQDLFVTMLPAFGMMKNSTFDLHSQLKDKEVDMMQKPYYLPPEKEKDMRATFELDVSNGFRCTPDPGKVKATPPCFGRCERDKIRTCTNQCKFNKNVTPMAWPTSNVKDMTMRMGNCKCKSWMDQKSAHSQMHKDFRPQMPSLVCATFGSCASIGVGFGHMNAPQHLHRANDINFGDATDMVTLVDDFCNHHNEFKGWSLSLFRTFTRARDRRVHFKTDEMQAGVRTHKAMGCAFMGDTVTLTDRTPKDSKPQRSCNLREQSSKDKVCWDSSTFLASSLRICKKTIAQ